MPQWRKILAWEVQDDAAEADELRHWLEQDSGMWTDMNWQRVAKYMHRIGMPWTVESAWAATNLLISQQDMPFRMPARSPEVDQILKGWILS